MEDVREVVWPSVPGILPKLREARTRGATRPLRHVRRRLVAPDGSVHLVDVPVYAAGARLRERPERVRPLPR